MNREIPNWVLPSAIICGVIVLGIVLWKGLTVSAAPVPAGQDIAVRPGMYDLRAEMKKPHRATGDLATAPPGRP